MSDDVKIKLSLDGDKAVITGLKGVGSEASESDSKLGKLASGGLKGVAVGAAAVGAAVLAAGAGLFSLARGAAEAGDRIDENANKLGFSYKAYQEWDYVLSQTGANIESLKGSLARLTVSVDAAVNGNQAAIDKFNRLGISVDDLKGKTREDIFALTIQGLQGVKDGGERAAIATQLLGRGASELGGLLQTSAEDTQALKDKAIELGLILSDEAVAAGDAFNDSLDTLDRTMQGVKNTIGAQLLPGLTEATLGLSGLLAGTEGSEERIKAGAETLIGSISDVAPRILQVFSSLLGAVAVVAPQIVGSLVEGITANLPSLVTTVTGAAVGLVGIIAEQGPAFITAGAQAIVALVTGVSTALPTLIPVIVSGALGMVSALIGALPLLLDAGLQLILGLGKGIIAAIPTIISMLPTLIEGIVGFIQTGVPLLLDAGIELFTALIDALPEVITQIVAILPTLITSVITALLGAIPLIIQAGITLLTSLVTALPEIITALVAAIPVIITSVLNAVLGAIPMLIEAGIDLFIALIGALPQIITAIVGAIPQIIGGVVGALTGAIPQIIMAGVKLLVALVQNMPAILSGVVGAIPQIIGAIVKAIGGGVGQLVTAGFNLIKGLWQGISDSVGWLLGKISGFVDQVMGGIKDFFGIKSPSRRLNIEVGAQLPPGLGMGVTENKEKALKPIRDMNADIMAEAQKLNTDVSWTNSVNLTSTPTPPVYARQPMSPMAVEATIDPYAISGALSDALQTSGRGQDRGAVSLDRESIRALGAEIVSGLRASNRQGVSVLG